MAVLKAKSFWIVSFIALLIIIVSFLPKPIDMDLDKIGNGRPSVVFVYDPSLAISNQQAAEMNNAKDIIGDKVTFLVLKVGNPRTTDFKEYYQARPPELLFFNSDGELVGRRTALVSSQELIDNLSAK